MNARAGVDYISILEAYNRETDFLSKMPDKEGMPIWKKMYIIDSENATGLLIPLSKDNETLSSILFATLDEKNLVTGVKDYDNQLLKNIVYNSSIDRDFREKIFFTFMHMDNYTFGNQFFTGIPNDLFKGLKYNNEYGRLKIKSFEPHTSSTESGRMIYEENCGPVWSCKNHETFSQCDNCNNCYIWSCGWTMVWVDNDFPPSSNIPGEGGGGGGTPGSGGTPPKDPCALTGVNQPFYRMITGCNGTGDTDLPSLDDPCSKIKSIVNNPKLKPKINELKNFSLTAVEDEMGYHQDKSGNVTPADVNGNHHVDFTINQNSLGGIHNHTLNGAQMFSPRDILTLLDFAGVQNQTLPIGSTADNTGNAFLGMISQSGSYFITFNGGSGDLPPPITQAEEVALEIKLNGEYKKIVINLLKAEGKNKSDDLSEKGLQKLFFNIIEKMGLEGKINLIKQDGNNTSTIQQNPDGTIKQPIPC